MDVDVIYNMDCLEGMKQIPDSSVDLILCDLPYGTTRNKWDVIIPFEPLWFQYRRVIKEHGAIVLFGDGMFTAKLILSAADLWRYNLIWDKQRGCDFLNANVKPLKCHEDICVFYKKKACLQQTTVVQYAVQAHEKRQFIQQLRNQKHSLVRIEKR